MSTRRHQDFEAMRTSRLPFLDEHFRPRPTSPLTPDASVEVPRLDATHAGLEQSWSPSRAGSRRR